MTSSEHGFSRNEMYKAELAGSVKLYDFHVVAVVQKDVTKWPKNVDSEEFSPLINSISSAIKQHGEGNERKVKFTIVEGDGEQGKEGDVFVYPQMVKYSGVTPQTSEEFVRDTIFGNQKTVDEESLDGGHLLICAHTNFDARCGACGPVLVSKFRESIKESGSNLKVWACSHIGGHKYAGNVIAYTRRPDGSVAGDWYGYVTPADIPVLLDSFKKGHPVDKLWRGAIGLSKEAQIAAVTARKAACGSGACGCFEASSALQSLSGWRVESSTKIALAALAGAFVCVGVAYYLRRQSV